MIFYVSAAGSDANGGTTETLPWATPARVLTAITAGDVRQGDTVLFRRSDYFYGKLVLTVGATGFTQAGDYCNFGAYGPRDRAKPVISSYKRLNVSGGWSLHAAGVWKLDLTNLASFTGYQGITPSVGDQVPDGTDIGHLLIDGSLYGGRKFGADDATAIAALSAQWDFYSDNAQWLYVKSSANPTTLAADIRAATDGSCVVLGPSLKFTGLRFEGSGAHGMTGIAKHCRAFGNELALLGGSRLDGAGDGTVRLGNGINLTPGSDDWLSSGNEISDTFDCAYTTQGVLSVGRIGWTNCHHRHNRHRRCSQNFEFWSSGTPEAGSGAVNCSVEYNDCDTTQNRWTDNGWRPGGSPGARHILFHQWDLGASNFTIRFNTFRGLPSGGAYHYMEVPPAGVTIDYNRVFLPASAILSGHTGESGGVETTQTVEQAAAWAAIVGTEQNSKFFTLPTDPTTPLTALQQLAANVVHVDARLQGVEKALSGTSADLEREASALKDGGKQQRTYQTLASSAGTQFTRIASIKTNGSADKASVSLLFMEAGDSSLAMGVGVVHFSMFSGSSNNVRINVSVSEIIPFPRPNAAALGTGPWFKASNFSTRLVTTDNAFAHEAALHFKLSDTFQSLQFVPLTEFKGNGLVKYFDQDTLAGSVPADYSTGAPTVIKTNRFYTALPTAQDATYAATITPVCTDAEIVNVGTLTGNVTFGAPTDTPYDGQRLTFRLTQDATGGRTVTWNAAYAFGTDFTAAMIPTTASAACEVSFRWNAAAAKWRCVGLVRGF